MAKRTTTVTFNGEIVGKRTSAKAIYTHAILVLPATEEDRKAAFEREAQRMEAEANMLEQAADKGDVVVKRRFPTSQKDDDNYFHSHEVILRGAQQPRSDGKGMYNLVTAHSNHKGEIETWTKYAMGLEPIRPTTVDYQGDQEYAYNGRDYLIRAARQRAEGLRESAGLVREQGAEPDDEAPSVVRWSSRRDLAEKALNEFEYLVERFGRRLVVVEVDQS